MTKLAHKFFLVHASGFSEGHFDFERTHSREGFILLVYDFDRHVNNLNW